MARFRCVIEPGAGLPSAAAGVKKRFMSLDAAGGVQMRSVHNHHWSSVAEKTRMNENVATKKFGSEQFSIMALEYVQVAEPVGGWEIHQKKKVRQNRQNVTVKS